MSSSHQSQGSVNIDNLVLASNALRKNIRRYFRSGLLCVVSWIMLAIMIPSWRFPLSIGYKIFAFSFSGIPLFLVIFFHFAVFVQINKACVALKKNRTIIVLYLVTALIVPLGAFLVTVVVLNESKKHIPAPERKKRPFLWVKILITIIFVGF